MNYGVSSSSPAASQNRQYKARESYTGIFSLWKSKNSTEIHIILEAMKLRNKFKSYSISKGGCFTTAQRFPMTEKHIFQLMSSIMDAVTIRKFPLLFGPRAARNKL